jgi:hypothetical protein
LHGCEDLFVGGETHGTLLRDAPVVHPHRELAAPALDKLGLQAGFVRNERCRTGSARAIVSDLAVTDADAGHDGLCRGHGWIARAQFYPHGPFGSP